jgi:hypothetical protein
MVPAGSPNSIKIAVFAPELIKSRAAATANAARWSGMTLPASAPRPIVFPGPSSPAFDRRQYPTNTSKNLKEALLRTLYQPAGRPVRSTAENECRR